MPDEVIRENAALPELTVEWSDAVAELRLLEQVVAILKKKNAHYYERRAYASRLSEFIQKRKNLASEQALKHYGINLEELTIKICTS